MKKLLLILPLLSVLNIAQAEESFCADVISYGVGPDETCVEFQNSCIPADYKRVPSCEVVEDDNRNTSLEARLRARFHSKNRLTQKESTKEAPLARYHRLGRSALTRGFSEARGTDVEEKTGTARTFTDKNFRSIYRRHNVKGGFDRGTKTTGHTNARQRPSFRSTTRRTDANETISSTPKWSATVKNHFKEKNYGRNPYSLSSIRSAQQRVYRSQQLINKRVDVQGRSLSRSRRWRPGGNFGTGSLSGDLDFLETEAEKKSDVWEQLNNE